MADPTNESALGAGTSRPGRGDAIPTSRHYAAGFGGAQAEAGPEVAGMDGLSMFCPQCGAIAEYPDCESCGHDFTSPDGGAAQAPMLAAALAYAAEGVPVFPCKPDKKPYTDHGFHDASTDPEIIRRWWAKWPDAMIGMPTGAASGRDVLDVDMDELQGKDGEAALAALVAKRGPLPDTQEVLTPRGGRHVHFLADPARPIPSRASKIGADLDIRGTGGYVILPPSHRADGKAYEWELSSHPDDVPLVPMPEWLRALAEGPKHGPSTGPSAAPDQVTVITQTQVEELRSALKALEKQAGDRDFWVAMAHALHELGAVGCGLWDEWSQVSSKYDPADARRVWDSAKGEHTGYRAVFAAAQRAGWVNPMAGGGKAPDDDDEALIQAAIEQIKDDAGALFVPDVIDALAKVKATDPAEYERLRDQAAKAGCRRLTELDKQVKKRERRFLGDNFNSSKPSIPNILNTGAGSRADDPAQAVLGVLDFGDGAMVRWTEQGPELLAGSHAAMVAAPVMEGKFAHCPTADVWHHFTGTHWEPQPSGREVTRAVTVALYPATEPVGFSSHYVAETLRLVANSQLLPLPAAPPMAIPFRSGLLDPATRQLAPISPTSALTWCLPYDFDPGADCPNVKAWLLKTVDDDKPTLELLRAWLAALLTGRADLQRFLHLPGPGGSGKGTFMRLCSALVGQQNLTSTDLRTLEQNRFESATIYGKRLVLITDSDKYGGSINVLKALTGQDPIRLERKHVQQSGTFTFEGLVMLASNEPLATTDLSSGFERRRITVEFNRVATEAEKQAWRDQGGEEAVLHRELPGVVNWALGLTREDVSRIITHPPQRTQAANLEALIAGNSVADWLVNRCAPDAKAWTQIWVKTEFRNSDGSTHFEHEEDRLYPSYLAWTRGAGRVPVSCTRFRHAVEDTAKNVLKAHIPNLPRKKEGQGIYGLRLLAKWEQPFDWLAHISGQPSTPNTKNAGYTCPGSRTNASDAGYVGFEPNFVCGAEKKHALGSESFHFQEPPTIKEVEL